MITGDRILASGKRGAFYNTLDELRRHFDHIDVICPQVTGAARKIAAFDTVTIYPSFLPLLFQPLYIIWRGWMLSRQRRYAIMTIHEYPPFYNGIGARLLWHIIKVPYVLEIMHVPGYPKAATLKERLYCLAMKRFIAFDAKRAIVVRVINRHETPGFLIRAGVPERKIVHVPAFYIDLDIFKPTDATKEYDAIFIGRLEKNKGIDLFIDSVKLSGTKALIVGDGPMAESTKAKIKNERLSDKITFHGWAKDAEEIAELINKSKILVVTSYNEGGPRVVLEAMACGVPVVATRVGMVPDIVPPESQCDWDTADIAAKCRWLLDDAGLYQRSREHGLKIVRQFERTASITAYADALKSFITS